MFASLKRLLDSGLGLAQVRLELFGTELEQEKLRLFGVLLRAALGLMLAGVALVLLVGFIVLLLWDGYRLQALGVLTLLIGAAGAALLYSARGRLPAGQGGPFALSLGELQRDRQSLTDRPAPPSE